FSRLGRGDLTKRRVDLNRLVGDARTQVVEQEVASDRRVQWTIHDLGDVTADPVLLHQVFVNLLSNALKYSTPREQSEITVGTGARNAGEVVVFVRDNGVGFDMAYQDKLFGVFQRLHSEEQFPGTGIGLANVKRIVERHGGSIWAESAPDRGAT